jgi:PKD repeat protein
LEPFRVDRGDTLANVRPVANFTISPKEPSTADAIQLLDCSQDPEHVGIGWRAWDFGDGATSVGPAPVHRYAVAGSYEVTLTLATFDGRVSTRSFTVRVRRKSHAT